MYNQIKSEKLNYNVNYDSDEINEEDNGNDFEPILAKQSSEINNLLKFMRGLPNAIFSSLSGS